MRNKSVLLVHLVIGLFLTQTSFADNVTTCKHDTFRSCAYHFAVDTKEALTTNIDKKNVIHDEMSSLEWDLPNGVVVTFYEHHSYDPRFHESGYFSIQGKGKISNLEDIGFGDCVSSWSSHLETTQGFMLPIKRSKCKSRLPRKTILEEVQAGHSSLGKAVFTEDR